MKAIKKIVGITLGSAVLGCSLLFGRTEIFAQDVSAQAQIEENTSVSFENVPKDAKKYTLKWADGSKSEYTGYDEVVKAAQEEKLLGTYTTDRKGEIKLSGYLPSGEIRIYEAVIPEGYTVDERNTKADLAKGSIRIVNRKAQANSTDTKENPVRPFKKDNAAGEVISPATSKTVTAPGTGDIDHTPLWTVIAAGAAVVIAGTVLVKKKKGRLLIILISAGAAGTLGFAGSSQAQGAESDAENAAYSSDFIIYKTDEEGKALEGAVFEVYSKAFDISWEKDPEPAIEAKNIVILYTNDVHCGVDNNLGYSSLAAYKKEMEADPANVVLLADAGDTYQGASLGAITKGEAILNIINELDYDVATPGNHDYDYGMDRFFYLTENAAFPYVSCNFTDLSTGELVFEPYTIIEAGGKKVAFVGVTTPTTPTSSTPKYFQDENGNYAYGFCEGDNGENLYKAVQNAADAARNDGADYCVLLSHLGIAARDEPYTSTNVITHTTGIDAVLDGHSHNVIEMEKVKNAAGKDVILTQDGYQLPSIGKLTIDPAGNIKSELITDYTVKDDKITEVINKENEKAEKILGQVIGKTDFSLVASNGQDHAWLVRNNETNLGDFVADAYRFSAGTEIAFINGGGLRSDIDAGEITYKELLDVNPFTNVISARYVKGSELADALEYSVYAFPDMFGGFLQVSGITFDIDPSVQSPVKVDENKEFISIDGSRRISNIKINGEPIDHDRYYSCASNDYILQNGGNGYNMFKGDMIDMGRVITDVDSLKEYLEHLGGNIPVEYSDEDGQGRMSFLTAVE